MMMMVVVVVVVTGGERGDQVQMQYSKLRDSCLQFLISETIL